MKKGAALSLVLALGGTAMFWVTQGSCASTDDDATHMADSNAPFKAANVLFIVFSPKRRVLQARLVGKYAERPVQVNSNRHPIE
jgi:hypothetical protein